MYDSLMLSCYMSDMEMIKNMFITVFQKINVTIPTMHIKHQHEAAILSAGTKLYRSLGRGVR